MMKRLRQMLMAASGLLALGIFDVVTRLKVAG